MLRRILFVVALSLSFSVSAQVRVPSALVPKNMIRDGRLEVASSNFSVASPAADWVWERNIRTAAQMGADVAMYKVSDPASEASFVITVLEVKMPQFTHESAETFVRSMLLKSESLGWKISGLRVFPSDVPVARQSFGYEYRAKVPDGRVISSPGYLVSGNRTFVLGAATFTDHDRQLFEAFARSFRLLDAGRH